MNRSQIDNDLLIIINKHDRIFSHRQKLLRTFSLAIIDKNYETCFHE